MMLKQTLWAAAAATALCIANASPAAGQAPRAAVERQAAWPGLPPGAVEEFMTTRDGARLAANVFKPPGPGPWPVILSRTPYLKDGRATRQAPNPGEALAAQARRYTDAGYVFVLQDVRGKGRSQGFYAAFENDIEDGYDTVEWVASQPWSNGKVGMTGASALGMTANLAALAAPPHLRAAYVVVAPADRLTYNAPGGVLKERDILGWLRQQGASEATLRQTRKQVVDDVTWSRTAMSVNRKYVRIPIFHVGGWFDIFNGGTVENFEWLQAHGARGARGNQKLLMGPFGHGELSGELNFPGFDRKTLAERDEIRWFDHWLKGVANGIMDEPPVHYFMMAEARNGAFSQANRMIASGAWPPAFREVRYFLTENFELTRSAPARSGARVTYRFDPNAPAPTVGGANLNLARGPMDQRAIGLRQDYIRFETPVLDRPVAIAGPVRLELFASTDGPDTDFVAKLIDVYPDGYEALILDAPIRTRYRHGRMPDDVRMMTPGAPEKLVIELWPTALTFQKGHRIALHVTSSSSPRFEVNPNTGDPPGAEAAPPRVATNTLHLDPDHPSALVLPVVYPGAGR